MTGGNGSVTVESDKMSLEKINIPKGGFFWSVALWLILIVVGVFFIVSNERAKTEERSEEGEMSFLTFTPNTLSQIYQDKWRVRPRKISGQFRMPPGDGPFPAVVILHGNFHPEELEPWFDDLVPRLTEAGLATFVIDSFSGRGIPDTKYNPAWFSRAARLVDAFSAMRVLAALPEIDEERIGISGYASGGTTAIISADRGFIEAGLARGLGFAAHLPVYPDCQPQFRDLALSEAPMLFLVGELDDYYPAKYCEDYVERMAAGGYKARIKKYPDTQHAWINDYQIRECERCATLRDCGVTNIEANGLESALGGEVTTQFSWEEYTDNLYQHCGGSETNLRVNEEARLDTMEATVNFFSTNLLE
jgi:dienelactone hydrolase